MDWLDTDYLIAMAVGYASKVLGAVLTLILGFWVTGMVTRWIKKRMSKNDRIDDTVIPFLTSLVGVGLKILVLLSVAAMFGIETTSFVAIFGAVAFAIGMALQGSLGHLASGVLILIFRPYKVGDIVEIAGGELGVVHEIQIFNTILKTPENRRIIVPNGVVTSHVITNISGQEVAGVGLTFGIGYEDDIDLAREVILKVGKECPYILDDPEQVVVVTGHGDSAIELTTRPFCQSEDYWPTKFYMMEHVKKAFDNEGISIPYPQRDVHIHQV
jgi:small conductance mechanosensitive channel